MSETTEDMLSGIACQICGQWMEDCWINKFGTEELNADLFNNPPGHPRTCPDCMKEINRMLKKEKEGAKNG